MRQLNDPSGIADALLNLGTIERQIGELAQARLHLEEALAKKRALGQKPGEAATLAALGGLAVERGDLAEARAHLEAAVASARESSSKAVISNALAALAEMALESGEFAQALTWAEESLALRRELGRRGKVDESRLLLARIALDRGQVRANLPELESLKTESSPGRSPDLAAAIEFARARALAAVGRVEDAGAALALGAGLAARSESLQVRLQAVAAALSTELVGARTADGLVLGPDAAIASAREKGLVIFALEIELLRLRRPGRREDASLPTPADFQRISAEATSRGLLRLARAADAAAGST